MIIPVRCFTCNKVIGHLWKDYSECIKRGQECGQVLDELGLRRYCCRRMFLSHVDVIDDLLMYSNNPGEEMPQKVEYEEEEEQVDSEEEGEHEKADSESETEDVEYETLCPRCDENSIDGDYNKIKDCETCERTVCIECVALTACQTKWGICKDCFDYKCRECGVNELDYYDGVYLDDADPTPVCDDCRKE